MFKLQIDFEYCQKYSITINEYCLLYLLYFRKASAVNNLFNKIEIKNMVESLKNKDLLIVKQNSNIELKDQAALHFSEAVKSEENETVFKKYSDDSWDEFLKCYPKKEGSRALHNLKSKCKIKYLAYINNPNSKFSHEEIVEKTKFYVKYKIERDSLHSNTKNSKYWIEPFQLLSTFVNNLEDNMERILDYKESEKSNTDVKPFGSEME